MPEDLDDLEVRMLRLSDDELAQMITADSDRFNQREIVFAEEALRDRGFRLERHDSDLRIISPDGIELTPRKTVIDAGRVGPVIRDVVIVWVLTAVGGFVAGVATGGPQRDAQQAMLAMMVSNFLLSTVAFTIAGCLAPTGRWRHLGFVALGTWLTSLINVVFFGVSIPQWLGGAIFTAIVMGIGGVISYVFKRDTKPSA